MSDCILVTGANGFLGSEIIRRCHKEKIAVQGTDLHEQGLYPDVPYYQADIVSTAGIQQAVAGVSCVIHTAGLAHIFNKSKEAPFKAVNEKGTYNVAKVASEMGVRHFILISSVSVYGESCSGGDESVLCNPLKGYAESKFNAEQRAIEIAMASDMRLTILRMATLYGEGDPGNIARLMRAIDRGTFVWIGDGSNRKSLVHREDAAKACLASMSLFPERIRIYNISFKPVTIHEIVHNLALNLEKSLPRWRVPSHAVLFILRIMAGLVGNKGSLGNLQATVRKWLADDFYNGTRFEKAFGFKASVDLEDGLRREVNWYRKMTDN